MAGREDYDEIIEITSGDLLFWGVKLLVVLVCRDVCDDFEASFRCATACSAKVRQAPRHQHQGSMLVPGSTHAQYCSVEQGGTLGRCMQGNGDKQLGVTPVIQIGIRRWIHDHIGHLWIRYENDAPMSG